MLEGILEGAGRPDSTAALSPQGRRTFGDLARGALAVAGLARGGGRWLLACEDPFEFAAGLFGLLRAGCTVVIPPNLLEGTLERLREDCRGVLVHLPLEARRDSPGGFPIAEGVVEFCTSGSTGTPKRISRPFDGLLAEVAILERLFGHLVQEGPILGTVPHHHIYGFLFRLLWPLSTGRPFITGAQATPDRFVAALREFQPAVLVSCPAHLSRMPQLVAFGESLMPPGVVFSSGGPLSVEDAQRWRPWVPGGVVEVFGSTETGGVAWRRRDDSRGSDAWTPFPDVSLSLSPEAALVLDTPRVPSGRHRMEDAASLLPDGRFLLKGRLDRIVKVLEKRVSLPEVESAIQAHPWIHQVAVVVLTEPRQMLGAAVVLHPDAPQLSPQALSANLRAHLAPDFDGAAIPRRWRVADHLPLNDQGKVEASRIRDWFASRDPR